MFLSVYRPPPSRQNKLTNTMFLEQFSDLLESYVSCDRLFVVGDPTLSLFFSRSLSSSVSTQAARVSRCAEGKTQAARVWCADSEQSNPGCTGLVCRKRAKQPRLHGFGVQKASKATQAARVWCAESEQSNPGCTGLVCRKRAKQPRPHGYCVRSVTRTSPLPHGLQCVAGHGYAEP